MKKIKRIFGAASALIGSVIGAGFITGREILTFFYGQSPVLIFLALFLLYFALIFLILIIKDQSIVFAIEKGDKAILFLNILSVASMLGATESLARDVGAGCDFPVWSISLLIISVIVCKKGMRGLETFNAVLVPVMLAVVYAVIFFRAVASGGDLSITGHMSLKDSVSFSPIAVLKYTAMNVLLTQPLLSDVKRDQSQAENDSVRGIKKIALPFFTSILTAAVLAFTAAYFLSALPKESVLSEIPVLYVAGNGKAAFYLISVTVALGIITTLVGSLYPLTGVVKRRKMLWTTGVCLLSLALSRLGFFVIVEKIYPLLGVLAIVYYAFTFVFLPSGVRIAERARTLRRQAGRAVRSRS